MQVKNKKSTYRVAHLLREQNMLTSNSKFRGQGQRINLQLNTTSNLVSTYFFPEADGPPCRCDDI